MRDSVVVSSTDFERHAPLAIDYPRSFVSLPAAALWLERTGRGKNLVILAPPGEPLLQRFDGSGEQFAAGLALVRCPTTAVNSAALRATLSWLAPVPLGIATSAGFGDRLGLATPGHARALQQVLGGRTAAPIAPIFAQQSIRELQRTARTPLEVLDTATWGAFQAGWRGPVGADADHLKTLEDIDAMTAAGYSFYTIDPGAYVDASADVAARPLLEHRFAALPWSRLESDPRELRRRYTGRAIELEDRAITLSEEEVIRATVKYGRAIAHVATLHRRLAGAGMPFDLEISFDESETPTSLPEHVFIAGELRRLGVQWVSLAPRFAGSFEKGIDFVGDLNRLRGDLEGHAAVSRACGPYKLSLHSGSDKFSVYPLLQTATRGLVHLKTAGTSYLEGLRVVSLVDPPFFRAILACARSNYAVDRASYHVSADLDRLPPSESLDDARLPDLLNAEIARQILHVTFGSILARYQAPLLDLLNRHEELYAGTLERHFVRHLEPFAQPGRPTAGRA